MGKQRNKMYDLPSISKLTKKNMRKHFAPMILTPFETYWQCLSKFTDPNKNCCLEVGILHPIKFHIFDPFHTQILDQPWQK